MHLIITTDGEANPNPGDTRIGVILENSEGTVIAAISEDSGYGTNNTAEYKAILRGLEEAVEQGAKTVTLYTDSQLADRQLRGVYRVKKPQLREIFSRIRTTEMKLDRVRYRWHGRDEGRGPQADALAKGGQAASTVLSKILTQEEVEVVSN